MLAAGSSLRLLLSVVAVAAVAAAFQRLRVRLERIANGPRLRTARRTLLGARRAYGEHRRRRSGRRDPAEHGPHAGARPRLQRIGRVSAGSRRESGRRLLAEPRGIRASGHRSESEPAPRHRRSPRGVDARRPSRGSARRGYGIRAPSTEREPGTASSAAPGPRPASGQRARWIASRKLPNRRRIVFSDGRIAASVQLSAVGSEPCSATNLRRAATDSSIRVSATSDNGTASPSNTPGGFVLWELRSTKRRYWNFSVPKAAFAEHRGPAR